MKEWIKMFFKGILLGVWNHPWKTLGHIFSGFSISFTLIQIFQHFFPDQKFEGWIRFLCLAFVGIIYGVARMRKPLSVRFDEITTTIEVIFGDLFQQEGLRAIPVNEFFDSKIGTPVSEKSLHGIFINKCFGGHPDVFDRAVEEQLFGKNFEEKTKTEGKTKSYPIGTTVIIQNTEKNNNVSYLAFALAKSRYDTCKAYCDVPTMWTALQGLWEKARNSSGGSTLNLPLVGSGQSGVNLCEADLLDLIVISALTETRISRITSKIRIVLHPRLFEKIDLRNLKRHSKG